MKTRARASIGIATSPTWTARPKYRRGREQGWYRIAGGPRVRRRKDAALRVMLEGGERRLEGGALAFRRAVGRSGVEREMAREDDAPTGADRGGGPAGRGALPGRPGELA